MDPIELKSQYRRPKQARSKIRFDQILDYTETLLENGPVSEITLNDIAEDLKIAVGSIYHFFPSQEALLLAAADRFLDRFADIPGEHETSAGQPQQSWQSSYREVVEDGAAMYNSSKPTSILLLGQAFSWQIRLADAAGNQRIAVVWAESLTQDFDFSFVENLDEVLFQSIIVTDAFWRRSYEAHGTITDDYLKLSVEAGLAFLRQHFPEKVPLRDKATSSGNLVANGAHRANS